ncbi:MAG: hydrolase [Planctomycetota bacterium]|jgi:nicotinamidase-related amidase
MKLPQKGERMLTTENTCLIVIDIQEKLLPVMQNPQQVVKNTSVLIQAAKSLNVPILWCQQVPKGLGPTVGEVSSLLEGIEPINKSSFSCGGDEQFIEQIDAQKPQTAILCGIETQVCVFQTAMDLIQKGLDVHVIANATSSRTQENKDIGINRMAKEGAVISSTEMLLFELLRNAKHEKFRELAKLTK